MRSKSLHALNALHAATTSVIETLESRRMLSAVINASKVLLITGTSGADIESITFASNRIVVRDNGVATKFLYTALNRISIATLAGDDTITLASNLPVLSGGVIIDAGDGNDTVTGSNLDDTISGGNGNDSIQGMTGDDNLFGQAGDDTLSGGDGDEDRVYPGTGNDVCDGGAGAFDTLSYQDRSDGVTARIDGGVSGNLGTGEHDSAVNFENVVGGKGNDHVIGNAGPNVVGGDDGDDTLDGGLGTDTIYGDAGVDTLDYSARTTPLVVNLATGVGGEKGENDELHTIENVYGGSNNDVITGDDNANLLRGGAGNDVINGGAGNDYITGDAGRDYINGGTGVNRLRGGAHNDTILGGNSRDNISGDDGDDSILAGGGDDYIDGGAGNDYIDGGLGTDTAKHDAADLVVIRVETFT